MPDTTAHEGPWHHGKEFDTGRYPLKRVISVYVQGQVLAHVNTAWGNGKANADLIAKSPKLLAALKALLPVAADGIDARDRDGSPNASEGQRALVAAKEAIAEAEGRS